MEGPRHIEGGVERHRVSGQRGCAASSVTSGSTSPVYMWPVKEPMDYAILFDFKYIFNQSISYIQKKCTNDTDTAQWIFMK